MAFSFVYRSLTTGMTEERRINTEIAMTDIGLGMSVSSNDIA